ncbi:MAG: zinc-ribbon domain-containing protein [Candidatus Thorarchaeota archaeon]
MAKCPKCGAKLYLEHKVCISCGSKIDFVTLRKKFEVSRRKRILWLIVLGFVLMILTIVLAILFPDLRSLLTVILATLFTIFAFAIILFVMYFYYIYR